MELYDAPFWQVHELYRIAYLRSVARMEREKAEKEKEEKEAEERKKAEEKAAQERDPRHPLRRQQPRPTDANNNSRSAQQQPDPSLVLTQDDLEELEDMMEEGM